MTSQTVLQDRIGSLSPGRENWLSKPAEDLPDKTGHAHGRLEIHWMLLVPTVLTALLALLCGLLGDAPFSPLEWSRLIVDREFGQ